MIYQTLDQAAQIQEQHIAMFQKVSGLYFFMYLKFYFNILSIIFKEWKKMITMIAMMKMLKQGKIDYFLYFL